MKEKDAHYLLKKNVHNRDRDFLLKQISNEKETKSRHRNAMEDRRLCMEKDGLTQSLKEHKRSARKEKYLVKHQIRDIPKIKTLSVDQYMVKVKQRTEGKRLAERKRISKMFKKTEGRGDELLIKQNDTDETDTEDGEVNHMN